MSKNWTDITQSFVAEQLDKNKRMAAQPAPPRQNEHQTAAAVNGLFDQLKAIYPAWRSAWPNSELEASAKLTWIDGFNEAGLHQVELIKFGLKQCRKRASAFIPSVGQFIAYCKPTAEDLGLPPVGKAYENACANAHPAGSSTPWMHPVVRHTALEVGYWPLMNLAADESRKLFERAYEIAVRDFMDGKEFEPIPVALTDGVKSSESWATKDKSKGNAAMAALRGK